MTSLLWIIGGSAGWLGLGYLIGRYVRRRKGTEWEQGYEAGMVIGKASIPRPLHRWYVVDPQTLHALAEHRPDFWRAGPREDKA